MWTNDGLVLSWIVSQAYSEGVATGGLSADLMLICINGRRPTKLVGATDHAIKLINIGGPSQAVHDCANVGSDVISETQRVLREDWKKYGGYLEQAKPK